MPEETGRHEPPTYFANLVTMNLNVDEMVMEFRRYIAAHRDFPKGDDQLTLVEPPKLEALFDLEPIVKVVLTFSAAKAIKQYLDQALPQIEKQRKSL